MALAAVVLAIGVTSSSAATPAQGTAKLSKEDRALLAQARLNNQSQVDLIIAAKPGANQKVADAVAALGANIRYREDTVDYVRALVPTDRVEAVAGLDGVEAVAFNVLVPIEDPRPEEGSSEAVPTPPGPGTPAENPQLPTRDIGAPQFVASHPTHDGRGVVIGILDTGIDVLTPELQTAKKLDGTPTRKIIDWKNFNDPLSGLDPSWVNMETLVTVSAGSFSSGAVTYTGVPADGTYQFGVFDESAISAASEYAIDCGAKTSGADLNRDGVCGEKFAVLWNTGDNTVRVDANADHSFAGEPAMRDYAVNFDIGIFGSDNPGTPTRETVPFTIQTDGKDKFVNIGVVGAEHGTHVAGIAAGKSFFGGAMNGAAPEAQIVSVRGCVFGNSCTAAALIEGMIYLERQANVDVINMSIGGLPALNDGNNARDLLYNRLIDQSKAQMFISAGNSGPGHNTVGDPSVATKVISVGAYVHRDTWFNDYGAIAAKVAGLPTGHEVDLSTRAAIERLLELSGRRPSGLIAGSDTGPEHPAGSIRLPEIAFQPSAEDAPVYILAPLSIPSDTLARNVEAVVSEGAQVRLVHAEGEIPRVGDRPPLVLNWGGSQPLPDALVTLNRPEAVRIASDQVESLRRLGALAPKTVARPNDIGLIRTQWVVAKRRHGTRGSGKAVISPDADRSELVRYDLFQELVPRHREYRISLLNGRVVSAYLKQPPEGAPCR